jgi:hypothetical protein
MKKLFSVCMILVLSVGFFTSCKEKDNGTAPVLPPQESFTIDFTNFASPTKSLAFVTDQKGINNSNWVFVAGDGSTTNPGIVPPFTSLLTKLIIPVSAFRLAVDNDPVFLDNNTWQWSYSVTPTVIKYNVRLTGQISSGNVLWKMYISSEGAGGFAEFVWFEGTSKVDGTGGQWTLNESPAVPQPVLQIDWTKPNSTIGTITYTYLKNNNYIEYGKGTTTSPLYDAYYKISFTNISGTYIANVEWNTSTKIGRVKCTNYQNGLWYCWDGNKSNNLVNCPQ